MAAVDSVLVPVAPDDTVDTVLAKVRAARSKGVQLLVPPDTGAFQAPRGFERLKRALDADGIDLLVFSVDEQVVAAAQRNAIEVIAIDDGRTKRPPLPPRSERPTRTTRVLPETQLDPRDAAFIDALEQVPARDRYADVPDADLYAALDDLAEVNQQLDRAARKGARADEDFAASLDEWSAGAAAAPAPARRYSADDMEVSSDDLARGRGARRAGRAVAGAGALEAAPARRSMLPVLLVLVLALLALAGAIWYLTGRASVTITPPQAASGEHPFSDVIIPLDPAGASAGEAVQAAPVTAEIEASATGMVQTESLSPAGTARGEVTIVNTIESAVPLPKGAEFLGTNASGEEVRFTLDADTTVPPAQTTTSLSGRSTTYGQVAVAVTARSPGSASNVGENAIKQILIPGQPPLVSDSSNFLIRHGPIGGGAEAPQRIVTEAEVEAVLAQALTTLYNTGVQELRAKIDEGRFGIDANTIAPSVADLSAGRGFEPLIVEPPIGQPVADPNNPVFTVRVRANFKALAAPRGNSVAEQLGPVVRDYFARRSDGPCKPGEVPAQSVQSIRWDGEKLMIDGVQTCSASGGLPAETLAKVRAALRGQSREGAEAGLRALQEAGLIGNYVLPDRAGFSRFDFMTRVDVAQDIQKAAP